MKTPRVVITGGGGDLAKAIAESLSGEHLDVLLPQKSELDVTDSGQVKSYFSTAGDVDLLICNAGVINDKSLLKMTETDWDEVISVNLKGAFLCAREVSKSMMKRRAGHIIFISSFSALQPSVGQASYAAAKSSLLGLTKSLAKELGARNIRVNTILPGFLETKMTSGVSGQIKEKYLSEHALKRFNNSKLVADFIKYAHLQMPHTSGQIFNLDSRVSP